MLFRSSRVSAYKLIEDALNLKEIKVFDQIVNLDGSKTSINGKQITLFYLPSAGPKDGRGAEGRTPSAPPCGV